MLCRLKCNKKSLTRRTERRWSYCARARCEGLERQWARDCAVEGPSVVAVLLRRRSLVVGHNLAGLPGRCVNSDEARSV